MGVTNHIKSLRELRIFKHLDNLTYTPLIENFDFTTIGLRTETPVYGLKGVKLSASYSHVVDGYENVDEDGNDISTYTEVVRKEFEYLANGVNITFKWFKHDGSVGIEKKIFKPLSVIEVAKINKANRDRTITYLQASAIGTPIEPYVNALLREYKTEVDLFIYNNTDDFQERVENEVNEPFLTYLNIVVGAPSDEYPNGKTVKNSILEQIS